MRPAIVNAASTTATATIQLSVHNTSFRRSTMSPIAPAGSARRKKGSVAAVWVNAIAAVLAPSDTISQAAPTLCMNVPMSDARSAMSRLRNIGFRSGCQRLGAVRTGVTTSGMGSDECHFTMRLVVCGLAVAGCRL